MTRLLKITLAVFCCSWVALQSFAYIHSDEPITFEDLPIGAQSFIKEHYAHFTVTRASYNTSSGTRNYEVNLSDNTTIQFDELGYYTAIECRDGAVPLSLIPAEIVNYINEQFAGSQIKRFETADSLYKLVLDQGDELTFDSHYQIITEDLNTLNNILED